jgi:hypothetical protein
MLVSVGYRYRYGYRCHRVCLPSLENLDLFEASGSEKIFKPKRMQSTHFSPDNRHHDAQHRLIRYHSTLGGEFRRIWGQQNKNLQNR